MRPEVLKLLTDVREAVDDIREFVAGKSLEHLASDRMLRSAIYFQFAVIGEARSQLRAIDETCAQRISEYRRIIAFRNQVIHGYAKVDDEITWRIINDKVPILRKEVEMLLREAV